MMHGIERVAPWLDATNLAAELATNWLIQSTLLLAIGLAVGWLLRHRGSAVQSVVYRTTLVAILASPIATWLLASLGASGWSIDLASAWHIVEVPAPLEPEPVEVAVPEPSEEFVERIETPPDAVIQRVPIAARPFEFDPAGEAFGPPLAPRLPVGLEEVELSNESITAVPPPTLPQLEVEAAEPPPPIRKFVVSPVGASAALASLLWLAAVCWLSLRLALAWRQLSRLARGSSPADRQTLALARELASNIDVSPPEVRVSPLLPSPCLAGLRRPMILLPEEPLALPLRDVLIHELAHLKRHDCLWNLLRQAACAVFCFQPLLWRLSARIEATAEEVCDDFVVQLGGDRRGYAHRLVDIAELSLAPVARAGVGIVSIRSLLGRRVSRILDTSRALSTRVGRVVLVAVLVVGLAGTMLAGLVGVSPKASIEASASEEVAAANSDEAADAADDDEASDDEGEEAAAAASENDESDSRARRVVGTVVDERGQPVMDADVALVSRLRTNTAGGDFSGDNARVLGETTTDRDGRFELATEPLSSSTHWWIKLLAKGPGTAMAWADVNPDDRAPEFEITLKRGRTARGRLVTLEGQPAANVTMRVATIGRHENGDHDGVRFQETPRDLRPWPKEITSDAQGSFEIADVPIDADVTLRVDQEPYAKNGVRLNASEITIGVPQVFPLPSAQIFDGQIVAEDTGEPLPHARLTLYTYEDINSSMAGIDGRADDEGRFRLNPYHASGYIISAFAPAGTPYLNLKEEIKWPAGEPVVRPRVKLPRGILVTGEIMDAESGEAVAGASLQYWPRSDNLLNRDELVTGWSGMHVADDEGRFAVAVLPGPGHLLIHAPGRDYVLREVGSSQLHRGEPGGQRHYAHAVVPLDFESDDELKPLNVAFQRGVTVFGRLVGSDGSPPDKTLVLWKGQVWPKVPQFSGHPDTIPGSAFRLSGVDPERSTPVLFLDPSKAEGTVLEASAALADDVQTVELEPCGTCTVRFVDPDGRPLVGYMPHVHVVVTPGPSRLASQLNRDERRLLADEVLIANFDRQNYWEGRKTDSDGRVTLDTLIPGATYRIITHDGEKFEVDQEFSVSPGESRELPEVTISNPEILEQLAVDENVEDRAAGAPTDSTMATDSPSEAGISQEAAATSDNPPQSADNSDPSIIRGRVVDSDGQPVAARILVVRTVDSNFGSMAVSNEILTDSTTRPDGTFRIRVPIENRTPSSYSAAHTQFTQIVALAEGYGPAWVMPKYFQSKEATLEMVPDTVGVEGRLLDLEGQPVAGVSVRVRQIPIANQPLDEWIAAYRAAEKRGDESDEPRPFFPSGVRFVDSLPGFEPVQTDRDGRFRLVGIGDDRYVHLEIEGPTIAKTFVGALTRETAPLRMFDGHLQYRTRKYFGARFDMTVEPSQPIVGVVRDKDSGEPLPGVEVGVWQFPDEAAIAPGFVSSTTNRDGRFKLVGLHKPGDSGRGFVLRAIPGPHLPYFRTAIDVPRRAGLDPVTCDIDLKRGIWLAGQVINASTREPVKSSVAYFPFRENANAAKYENFRLGVRSIAYDEHYGTDDAGRFRIPAISGRGVLSVTADRHAEYRIGVGVDEIDGVQNLNGVPNVYHMFSVDRSNALVEINAESDADEMVTEVAVSPQPTATIDLLDPDGAPLHGVHIGGREPRVMIRGSFGYWGGPLLDTSITDVILTTPYDKRLLLLYHKDRKLGLIKPVRELKSDAAAPQPLRLQPCADVTGRLVDENGSPLAKVYVAAHIGHLDQVVFGIRGRETIRRPRSKFSLRHVEPTDEEGRFRWPLLPGTSYTLVVSGQTPLSRAVIVSDLEVGAGEQRDLGDLVVRPHTEQSTDDDKSIATTDALTAARGDSQSKNAAGASAPRAAATAGETSSDPSIIRGRVVDSDGQPIAGAKVYTVLKSVERNTWINQHKFVGEFATDQDGRFEAQIPEYERQSLSSANRIERETFLLAAREGFGIDTAATDGDDDITITLVKDTVPLMGRVLDLEGQPVAGVQVSVRSIMTADSDLDEWIAKARHNPKSIDEDELSAANSTALRQVARFPSGKFISAQGLSVFPPVITNRDGRFRIDWLGPDRYISLEMSGGGIAKTHVHAVTRQMEPVSEPTAFAQTRSKLCYGATFDYSAEPEQVVTGIVRDQKTGEPLEGAEVTVYTLADSTLDVQGFISSTTDADGRYRLLGTPKPIVSDRPMRLRLIPGAQQPYFRTEVEVAPSEGLDPIQLDIDLPRAVWLTGRVLDQQANQPVQGFVSYYPFLDNPHASDYPNFRPGRSTIGHDDAYATEEDGTFRIPVIPGRGVVMATALNGEAYHVGAGAERFGWRMNSDNRPVFHAHGPELCNTVREVNIDPEQGAIEYDMALVPLQRQTIQLVDDVENALDDVKFVGQYPFSVPNTKYESIDRPSVAEGSVIDIFGLEMDGRRLMLFFHDERKLGTAAIVEDGATERLALGPYATITGRILDSSGVAISGISVAPVIGQSQSPEPNDKRGWGRRSHYLKVARTDAEGRFRFESILPGVAYEIHTDGGRVATTDVVEPGALIELGDLTLDADEESDELQTAATKPVAAPSTATTSSSTEVSNTTKMDDDASDDLVTVRGRVVDPDGGALSGAEVHLVYYSKAASRPSFTATTGENGDFEFLLKKSQFDTSGRPDPWAAVRIVATHEDLGADWAGPLNLTETDDVHLRLVADIPIEGRVLTLEGNPVAGARVRIRRISETPDRSLDSLLAATHADEAKSAQREFTKMWGKTFPAQPNEVITDDAGRFRITGVGEERLVVLLIEGPGIHWTAQTVVTRSMAPISLEGSYPEAPRKKIYGVAFEYLAMPGRTIQGTVVNKVTGEPIAGARVHGGHTTVGFDGIPTTDAQGRYEIPGCAKSDSYNISVTPHKQPALGAARRVEDTTGLAPLVVDFALDPGIVVGGTVTDKTTGEPIKGEIEYYALDPNEYARRQEGGISTARASAEIQPDGTYEIAVLPGPGVIGYRARGYYDDYMPALVTPEDLKESLPDDPVSRNNNAEFLQTAVGGQTVSAIVQKNYNHLEVIAPREATKELLRDVQLDPGRTIAGKVVDSVGNPLSGVTITGHTSHLAVKEVLKDDQFIARAINPRRGRHLVLRHPNKNLAAALDIRGNEAEPLVVRLEPVGRLTGRVLNGEEGPIADATIGLHRTTPVHQEAELWAQSDAQGSFQVAGLVPDQTYSVRIAGDGGLLADEIVIQPGETIDLGTIDITSDERPEPVRTSAAPALLDADKGEEAAARRAGAAESAAKNATKHRYRGKVIDPTGTPVNGAELYLVGIGSSAREPSTSRLLGRTGAAGEFDLTYESTNPAELRNAILVTAAEEYGPDWVKVAAANENELTLQLEGDELPIKGQILDLEGSPIAGATVRVKTIRAVENNDLSRYFGVVKAGDGSNFRFDKNLFNPPHIEEQETDASGRFRLTGIGSGRRADLEVVGRSTERAVLQVVTIDTKPISGPKDRNPSRIDRVYGSKFTFFARPSRVITGVVVDSETRAPLAGVKVSVSGNGSQAETDEDGRFELFGAAKGDQYPLIAWPNDDLHLLGSMTVEDTPGLEPLEVEIPLPRGVTVSGRVTDASTGEPVAATVSYYPVYPNRHIVEGVGYSSVPVLGDWASAETDADGNYTIAALAGPGFLGVKTRDRSKYQSASVDAAAFYKDKIPYGGSMARDDDSQRDIIFVAAGTQGTGAMAQSNFQAIELLMIDPEADSLGRDIQLHPSAIIRGRVVGPNGQPIGDVRACGLTPPGTSAMELLSDGTFSANGMRADETRRVIFRHDELKLVAAVNITAEVDQPLTVRLEPWGEVKGRFVDDEGVPLANVILFSSPTSEEMERAGFLAARQSTDGEGRFHIKGLVPGRVYRLRSLDRFEPQARVVVDAGETKDLGTIRPAAADDEATINPIPSVRAIPPDVDQTQVNREGVASPLSYSGQVTDLEGEPIADANIWLAVTSFQQGAHGSLQEVAKTDGRGHFHFALDAEAAHDINNRRPFVWRNLVATAVHHGLDWLPLQVFEEQPTTSTKRDSLQERIDAALGAGRFAARTLNLCPEDRRVRGRLVDLEGQPLPNVTVLVERLARPDITLLMTAFEESSNDRVYEAQRATSYGMGGLSRRHLQQLIPSVTSDENGVLTLAGIGNDQLVTLSLAAEHVEAQLIRVLGRSMETVRLPHINRYPDGPKDVYAGRDFTCAVGPSVPIQGVVKDYDTGEPVAETIVYVERLFKEGSGDGSRQLRLDTQHMRTVTDERGRFRITGMPLGNGHVLEAIPPKSEPYLVAAHDVSLRSADADVDDVEIQVKKTIWITGQVRDKQSGEPIQATVDYLALRKNPNTLENLGLRQGWVQQRYWTDGEGRYRVPGFAGPGVLLVTSQEGKGYPKAVGAETIDGYREDNGFIPTTPIGLPVTNWHLLKQIDPAPDATSFSCDLVLDAGQSIPGRVVGPKGAPISEFSVIGEILNDPFWKESSEGNFTVDGYDGQGPRQLFFQTPDENLVGQFRLVGDAPEEILVTLEPAVRVTGRLIENETDLPAARYGFFCETSSLGRLFRVESPNADVDGRFEINGLMAGMCYEMNAFNEEHFVNNRNHFKIDLTTAKPGDAIELGDVTGPESKASNVPSVETHDVRDVTPQPAESESESSTPTAAPDDEAKNASAKVLDRAESIPIRGRVVDPDGRPAAGARIFVQKFLKEEPTSTDDLALVERAQSDGDGRFEFDLFLADFHGRSGRQQLIAFLESYGVAGVQILRDDENNDLTLELVEEQTVRGRVLDTEGRPVAGARLQGGVIMQAGDGELDQFINGWTQDWNFATNQMQNRIFATGSDEFARATTDTEGRFEITGLGAERVTWLQISGPGIAQTMVFLVTREGVDVEKINREAFSRIRPELRLPGQPPTLVGPTFDFVAEPAKSIEGTVREAESGEPLPGVRMMAGIGFDNAIMAVTDDDGHYRLAGLPRLEAYSVHAMPPKSSALLADSQRVEDAGGYEQQGVDFVLPRGAIITGRVIDRQTGQGVSSSIRFAPIAGNPYFDKPQYDNYRHNRMSESTDADGNFRLVTIPGPGVLMAQATSREIKIGDMPVNPYQQAQLSEADRRHVTVTERGGNRYFTAADQSIESLDIQRAVKYLDLPQQDDPTECELYVERGEQVELELQDPGGRPLEGVVVAGLTDGSPRAYQLDDARATVLALDPKRPRQLFFYHRQRRLAGALRLTGEEQGPLVQPLEPALTITGRAVDADGLPVEGAEVEMSFIHDTARELDRFLKQSRKALSTDEEGRFEFSELAPGQSVRLIFRSERTELLSERFTPKSDEATDGVLDLGEVTVGPRGSKVASSTRAPPPEETDRITTTGRVLGPDGRPAGGAHLAVIALRIQATRGGDLRPNGEVLAEGLTNDSGHYNLSAQGVSSKTHRDANVIARTEGSGIAWHKVNLDASNDDVSLELPSEKPISGKLVDIEGQVAGDVRLRVRSVMPVVASGEHYSSTEGVRFDGGETTPAAWIPPLTSDSQGRFTIHGVSAGLGLYLEVVGSDRFAPQDIALNTGMSEQRGERDGTYRALVKNADRGEEAVLALAPAQIFEGVVRYDDTGEPAPHARLTIWSSQQQQFGSMVSVPGKADAEGRYRISPKPGIRFGVNAYPPNGVPYLARQTPLDEAIRWDTGERVKKLDVTLPRGLRVQGKVVQSGTGSPISGAVVQYIPESANNPYASDDVLTGWQDMQLSNDEGQFAITVLPGPGRLLAHGPDGNYVLNEIGGRQLYQGQPGGRRNYAHAIQKIDPELDAELIDVTIELQRGEAIVGRIVDEQGENAGEALVISRLNISPYFLQWHGHVPSTSGSPFELAGLEKGEEYRVHFLDATRRLGATAVLKASDQEPTVVLEPCGSANLRFVDGDGRPAADYEPTVQLVVTPGAHESNTIAMRAGLLAADADFISNIDRVNYRLGNSKSDKRGILTLPVLIPGATYRVVIQRNGRSHVAKEFQGEANGTIDLGDIVVARPDGAELAVKEEKPADEPATTAVADSKARENAGSDESTIIATGRVLGIDGQPIQGAEIYFAPSQGATAEDLASRVKTDAAGRFRFAFPKSLIERTDERYRSDHYSPNLVARMSGFGLDWKRIEKPEDAENVTLRLIADDVPITGRIVDLEGRPVTDATIRIIGVDGNKEDTLDAWIDSLKDHGQLWRRGGVWLDKSAITADVAGLPDAIEVDDDGRFRLDGIGGERVVSLSVEGPTIETTTINVMTRTDEGFSVPYEKETPEHGTYIVYGAKFDHAAAPARPVEGVVRDAETGEGIPGVAIFCRRNAGSTLHGRRSRDFLSDAEGRYRVTGLRIGRDNEIAIVPPADTPYVQQSLEVDTTGGVEPLRLDIGLEPGVLISGQVTDGADGAPVVGARVEYFAFSTNPHAQTFAGFREADDIVAITDEEGRYALAGLPGRGLIAVRAASDEFAAGHENDIREDDYHSQPPPGGGRWFQTEPVYCEAQQHHAVAAVEPPDDAHEVTRDIVLERGRAFRARIIGPDGKPVTGAHGNRRGIYACQWWGGDVPIEGAEFTINGVTAQQPRVLFVHHKDKGLAAAVTVAVDMPEPLDIQLQLAGTLAGRLVDDEGRPVAFTRFTGRLTPDEQAKFAEGAAGTFHGGHFEATSDKDGHFSVAGLLPGREYQLRQVQRSGERLILLPREAFVKFHWTVTSGETLDLGDILVSDPP